MWLRVWAVEGQHVATCPSPEGAHESVPWCVCFMEMTLWASGRRWPRVS